MTPHPALGVGSTRTVTKIERPTLPVDLRSLPLYLVEPSPTNHRRDMDEQDLADLAGSIREHGLQSPIRVRRHPSGDGRYLIVAGHRRHAAHVLIGAAEILAIVCDERTTEDDSDVASIVENLFRSDPSAVDYGLAFRRLLDLWKVSQAELARRLSVSTTYVSRMLAVAELEDDLRSRVAAGDMNYLDALRERDRRAAAAEKPTTVRRRRAPAAKRGEISTPFGTVKLRRGRTLAELVEHLRGMVDQERRDAA